MSRPRSDRKIVLITRATRLDDLVARYNTRAQAKFYIAQMGGDFDDIQSENEGYLAALDTTLNELSQWGRAHILERKYLPNYVFGPDDLVLALGQDGLVANALKYTNGLPIAGINPDPRRYDGVLLPFHLGDLPALMADLTAQKRACHDITMAECALNDGQRMLAVNDFFIGQKSHTSARYIIRHQDRRERQSSSGILVSTGLGASGWMRSVFTGARALHERLESNPASAGRFSPAKSVKKGGHDNSQHRDEQIWESTTQAQRENWGRPRLVFYVREPFPSQTTQTGLVYGEINPENPLIIESQMGENGVIFSDGIEQDFLTFNSGIRAEIRIASSCGRIIV